MDLHSSWIYIHVVNQIWFVFGAIWVMPTVLVVFGVIYLNKKMSKGKQK